MTSHLPLPPPFSDSRPAHGHFGRYLWPVVLLFLTKPGLGDAVGRSMEIRAQLTPRQITVLSTELSAKIKQLTVQEGDHFSKGQLLVAFDCATHDAQLRKRLATLKASRKKLQVNKRLSELSSIRELDVEMARIEVAKAEAEVDIQRITVDQCTIKAPFAGGVAQRMARPYEYLKAGSPLMEIVNDHDLNLALIVPSHWLPWLKVGQPFRIHVDETKKSYPATVIRLGIQVDPVSQSIKVIGRIVGVFPELKPGMSGRVVFPSPPG